MRDATSGSAGRVSVGAVFAAVLLAALVAGYGWQRLQHGPAPAPEEAVSPPGAPAVSRPTASSTSEPTPMAEPRREPPRQTPLQPLKPEAQSSGAVRPRLQAWVVFAGQDIRAEADRISLPTGARLALKLRTNVPGTVAMYTLNPQGVESSGPLWETMVKAQKPVTSPTLRLEGAQGLETIRLQFKPDSGGPPVWQTVQLMHL